jgi:hypothetical protein
MRAHSVAVLVSGAFLAAGSVLLGPAQAQNAPAPPAAQDAAVKPIGKVITAKGTVTIQHVNAVVVQAALGNQPGSTKIGDPIYLGDIVQTGSDGRLGIVFTDGTAFDLSSNARMLMNEFVYDPNSKSNSTLLSLTKGAFTFVAGNIAKTGDMKIDTPVATMGIRGTTPHVEISDDGTVKFSTLIEKGKNQVLEKYGGLRVTPRASGPTKREKINLKICSDC